MQDATDHFEFQNAIERFSISLVPCPFSRSSASWKCVNIRFQTHTTKEHSLWSDHKCVSRKSEQREKRMNITAVAVFWLISILFGFSWDKSVRYGCFLIVCRWNSLLAHFYSVECTYTLDHERGRHDYCRFHSFSFLFGVSLDEYVIGIIVFC